MASQLDQQFPSFAHLFEVPTLKSLGVSETDTSESLYVCGNSLGLMPKSTRQAVNDELDAWASRGVESHFNHSKTSWVDIDLPVVPLMAKVVGAKESEVAVMGTLTMNLNSLLCAFYRPSQKKRKILFEKQAFPSDYYAFLNQVRMHGGDESDLLQISPRDGCSHLETSDILAVIEEKAEEIALVCFSGIQYYTGQFFEMEKITKCAKANNCIVGWDLAHAVGNVELKLHDWDVDFACWCSYKYLNSGPGSIAGIFVNGKCSKDMTRLAGWWGNNATDRFKMLEQYDPIEGALGFRQSNPSVIDVVSLHNSLKVFDSAGGMAQLRKKGLQLSVYLQRLLQESPFYEKGFRIISPLDPHQRGCQISLFFESETMERVFEYLHSKGVICDERRPNVIRIAPAPLYNSFKQIDQVVELLNEAFTVIY